MSKLKSKSVAFDGVLGEKLKDREFAAEYLTAVVQDGDPAALTVALKKVRQAQGVGMVELARETGLNRESLYRTLSDKGNPEFATVRKVAGALGFSVQLRPAARKESGRRMGKVAAKTGAKAVRRKSVK